ncbi:hypothetical protein BN2475_130070 [Paraburkholderia ribeironis]|uniref:Uncharacterized protein n=1 Tax=Paraburkholderia ribeironis TaxID=1247936 RepID=A0A1N7RSI4_9BURK|nr:hypothetical protein BN2475_130070 [Paraburkholderia ribeironis]
MWVDGIRRLDSDSMFVAHDLYIELDGSAMLALCFRSLTPALAAKCSRALADPAGVAADIAQRARHTARPYARQVSFDPGGRPVAPSEVA